MGPEPEIFRSPERRRSEGEQGSRAWGLLHARHIHNFMTLEPFLRKSVKTSVLFEFPAFSRILEKKNHDGDFFFENYFWQTRKKATSVVSEPRSESSSLGPIGTDFARKKVLLYEIDDEEVI